MKHALNKGTLIRMVIAILAAVLSFTLLSNIASNAGTHNSTFAELDAEKNNVTMLLGASTAASAAITMIPDDVGTPIADKLAGLSSVFIALLSILLTEKYTLTIIGFVVFRIVIPLICLLYIIHLLRPFKPEYRKHMQKFLIYCLVVFHLIPAGAWVSKTIYTTWNESISETFNAAINVQEETSSTDEEDKGWFQNLIDGIVDSATAAVEWAKTVLNKFVEATAVLLVTSCIIPLLVFIALLKFAKFLTGFDFAPPLRKGFSWMNHRRHQPSLPSSPGESKPSEEN